MPCSTHASIMAFRMPLKSSNVGTFEKPVQQIDGQRHDFGFAVRPDKAIIGLESLEHEPETVVLPAQDLDAIASPVGKDVERGIHGIQAHRLFDENRQTVHSVPEIDRVAVQVHLQIFVEPEHGILPNIWTTVLSSSMLAALRSSSTPFDSRTCSESVIGAVVVNTSGNGGTDDVETTGTNAEVDGGHRRGLREPATSVDPSSMQRRKSSWAIASMADDGRSRSAARVSCDANGMPFSGSIRYFAIHLRSRLALIPCSCAK